MTRRTTVRPGPEPSRRGTREWSSDSGNCLWGCSHNCRYCYAREMAERFKRLPPGGWSRPLVNASAMGRIWTKKRGVVMFPTSHDILPQFIDEMIEYARNILDAGNRLLIVSKPHLEATAVLLEYLLPWREQIEFRATITADDDELLEYWEPEAPRWTERREALAAAQDADYLTSVSIEPMLDPANIGRLVRRVGPYVTGVMWIGLMNQVRRRVKIETAEDRRQVERIEAGQTDERIMEIVGALQQEPGIRWKDSIRAVIARSRE